MRNIAIKVENLSKAYQLGEIGTGTISRDLERWFAKVRGKEDPFLRIGESNDRTAKGGSDVVWSLKDISFEIEQGDAVGIIGRNGAGKSTLLKIISRITSPTTGRIQGKGRIASLLEVGTGFHPELTGRENIFLNGAILGMRKREIQRQFDQIVDFAGVERYVDTPVKRYSSGMYVRLAFAVAAHLESEILIVDEVLAVGDAEFQKKCLGKMGEVSKGEGRTVLFVSHNMGSIRALCSKCILMSNGRMSDYDNRENVIGQYLNANSVNSFTEFPDPLEYVEIKQQGNRIIVEAGFKPAGNIIYPHLGIVVKDIEGIPIFGTNPTIENQQLKLKRTRGGKIKIEFEEPKLYDGEYLASIWYGDKGTDTIVAHDCIRFRIEGMTTNQRWNANIVGNIAPKSKWTIIEN